MKDRLSWLRKNTAIIFFSALISFLFVAVITYAATTISTNVNTGGTLTVTGASTLTGAVWATSTLQVTGNVTTYGASVLNENSGANDFRVESDNSTHMLYVDGTNDRVGIGSSTPIAFFSVGEGAGTVTGDIYMTGGLTVGSTSTANSIEGTVLLASTRMTDPTGTEGLIYYNSSSKKVRLYNGTSWGVIGTSTGLDLIGSNIRMVTPGTDYFTLGTTTAQGASLATLEATSTLAIPLTLVARDAQAAHLFQIRNSGSANLLYVNSAGALFGSSTAQVSGALTTYGAVTLGDAAADAITITGNASTTNALSVGGAFYVGGNATTTSAGALTLNGALVANGAVTLGDAASDVITITGNASTTGGLTVGTLASTTQLVVGGNGTNGTLSGLVFGYCTIGATTVAASSTAFGICSSATGIRVSDRVFVTATSSLPANFIIQAASSTAANVIGVRIFNSGIIAGTDTGVNSFDFIGIR